MKNLLKWVYMRCCETLFAGVAVYVVWCMFTGQMAWANTYSSVSGVIHSNQIITNLNNASIQVNGPLSPQYITKSAFTYSTPTSCRRIYDSTINQYAWICWYILQGEGWYFASSSSTLTIIEPNICVLDAKINDYNTLRFNYVNEECTRGCHP